MYKKQEHLHFIGIGGIGMSGIAEILRLQGYTISGCDRVAKSKTLDHLKEIDCTIFHGHDKSHLETADVLVYSSDVNQENEEIQAALEKGIPVIPRAIMLAELMRTKYSIAVSGAHGKTTTTSLISHIFMEAGKHPTIVIGGILKSIGLNAQLGKGNVLIAEADESDRSLLYLNPTMAVVTNIDTEHLNVYKDLEDIKQTFKNFLARLPFYGKAFLCIDDPHVQSILPLPHISTVKYGLSTKADVMADIIELGQSSSTFDVYSNISKKHTIERGKKLLGRVTLNIPGEHNVLNALAAISLCLEFDISFKKIAHALSTFHGVERRFEFKGSYRGVEIFDDYGHHPTEILKTLLVAQRRKQGDLRVVFQPHRYTRTEKLWDDFVNLFAHGHEGYQIASLYLADIYPASELPIPQVTSERLVESIKLKNPHLNVVYCQSYDEIVHLVNQDIKQGDLLLTIGAGKVNQVAETLLALNA